VTESAHKISIRYDIAKDLVETKQKLIRDEIQALLLKWNQVDAKEFINNAKIGILQEAEHDALLMKNLLYELDQLEKILA
jgi:hypothetical protein